MSIGLFAATLVLWGFAGWTWWVLLPLLIAGLVVRLVVSPFFDAWREWGGPAVLVVTIVFLMAMTTIRASLIAFGLVVLGIAWGLRLASPKWLRWVALGLGLAMLLGGGLAEFVVWANNRAAYQQAQRDQHDLAVSRMRPASGIGMMNALVRWVSEDDPGWGCWLFTPSAAAEFAQGLGAPDCPAAIHQLHGQITNAHDYANATAPFSDSTGPDITGVVRVSGCNLYAPVAVLDQGPPGGPKLGQLRLEKDSRFASSGYLITGYTPCGVQPPGTAPSAPSAPEILPSYAPAYAGILAEAVAGRDTAVCVYFTDQGKREFAATYHVADCAAAVDALAARVTGPDTYRNPRDATEGKSPDGKTTVDACHLTWSQVSSKPSDPPPGPLLGTLTLTAGPRGQGYLIDGYQQC